MDLKGFTDLGGDIGKRVSDAVNTGDYSRLNQDIRRKIEQAFTGNIYDNGLDGKLYKEPNVNQARPGQQTAAGPNAGFDRWTPGQGQPYGQPGYVPPQNMTGQYRRGVVPVTSKPPKKGGPIAMMICGYIIAAVFGIIFISMGIMSITAAVISDGVSAAILGGTGALMLPFTAGGLVLGIAGTKKYGTAKRFRAYCNALEDDSFCPIEKMAASIHKDQKFTVKDLQKMIDKRYFPEGHIDEQKTCFIGTEQTYQQYLQAKESAARARAAAEAEAQGFRAMPTELRQVIEEGNAYIKTIREANDAIIDEVISNKLYRMEIVVKKIFEYVRENPEQVDQLRRFMSYYMPTTEKLVKAYQQLDEESIQGKNVTKAMEEIAQTLDTINDAYEQLYDSMYVDVAMDVSSDISVLKTMFAQEGLTKDELSGGK